MRTQAPGRTKHPCVEGRTSVQLDGERTSGQAPASSKQHGPSSPLTKLTTQRERDDSSQQGVSHCDKCHRHVGAEAEGRRKPRWLTWPLEARDIEAAVMREDGERACQAKGMPARKGFACSGSSRERHTVPRLNSGRKARPRGASPRRRSGRGQHPPPAAQPRLHSFGATF